MNKKITFAVPIEGFQYLQGDAFIYHTIIAGHTVLVPENTEYLVTRKLTLVGTLELKGKLVIRD